MNKRLIFLVLTIVLIGIEVLIALFVHDNFIRPYVGDMLVVIVLYTAIRIFIPEKFKLLPLAVFLFASFVEFLQYLKIVEVLGLETNPVLRVAIGSVADIKDVYCYAVGCILLGVFEFIRWKKNKGTQKE